MPHKVGMSALRFLTLLLVVLPKCNATACTYSVIAAEMRMKYVEVNPVALSSSFPDPGTHPHDFYV